MKPRNLAVIPDTATTAGRHGCADGLTARQQRFVEEYLIDPNATQAAIRAGYSMKTANEQGSRLLANVSVSARIAERQAALSKKLEVNQEWVLNQLVENANRAMQAEPARDREGNAVGTYAYQGAVANRALELLGKHLGMFTDRGSAPLEERPRQVFMIAGQKVEF